MRTGVLLRTAGLAQLADSGVAALADLGVSTVLDLRGDSEVSRDGADRVPANAQVRRHSMDPAVSFGRAGGGQSASADPAALIAGLIGADDPQAVARTMMADVYSTFVVDPSIRAAVGATLTDIGSAPGAVVVHCSAGKDRTGWIVALVQYLCDVSEEDRVAEYLASRGAASGLAAAIPPIPGLDPIALAPLLTVEADYLQGAWELAVREFGGMDDYVAACGVGDATRKAVVERLIA